MIADMLSNKKLNPIVTELSIRGRKLNISLVFFLHSPKERYVSPEGRQEIIDELRLKKYNN